MAVGSGVRSNGHGMEPFSGPCQHMMQAWFGGFDKAAQSWDPVAKGMAQASLEVIGFWNRRAQAYLDVPSRLQQCRSPQDFAAEQMRFCQTAFTQYQDSSRKLMMIWANSVPDLPFAEAKRSRPERDYITINEPADAEAGNIGGLRAA